jgi:hypothetical protein
MEHGILDGMVDGQPSGGLEGFLHGFFGPDDQKVDAVARVACKSPIRFGIWSRMACVNLRKRHAGGCRFRSSCGCARYNNGHMVATGSRVITLPIEPEEEPSI